MHSLPELSFLIWQSVFGAIMFGHTKHTTQSARHAAGASPLSPAGQGCTGGAGAKQAARQQLLGSSSGARSEDARAIRDKYGYQKGGQVGGASRLAERTSGAAAGMGETVRVSYPAFTHGSDAEPSLTVETQWR